MRPIAAKEEEEKEEEGELVVVVVVWMVLLISFISETFMCMTETGLTYVLGHFLFNHCFSKGFLKCFFR